ncbi:hypothetical protein ANCDUO_00831 [Ancylostoma duodenale]|uniref:Uncharacterized protein n=1 Tax=Ancylostoma duodenale TaxID=51022 RepID=A0A0C2HB08_9BILA|nr:hypothetical protein ANCDUO_00831 [Ancylostoma duodenale]
MSSKLLPKRPILILYCNVQLEESPRTFMVNRRSGASVLVPGKKPKGRQRQRWAETLHKDLKIVGLHPDQSHERSEW